MRVLLATVALGLGLSAPLARAAETLDLVSAAREADRLAEGSFREMLARERRLLEVSTRVRRGGLALCGSKQAPILGLQVVSRRGLPAPYLTPAIRAFSIHDDVRVVSVLPGEPSARAGIAPGDVLVSVDDFPLDTPLDLNTRRAPAEATHLRFVIERGGKRRTIDVPYEPGCYVEPLLALSSSWQAYQAHRQVVVSSELIREVQSDDELAVVIGHELAHAVLDHGGSAPDAEAEADYLGLYLAALGGYDVEAGVRIWNRFARTKPWALLGSETHPSAPQRALALERAMSEIREKRARNAPLRPEQPE